MWSNSPGKARILLFCLILTIVLALAVCATYVLFTSQYPSANDFYSRWAGGCALIRDGLNPYSETVTVRIQEGMRGRPSLPDEDQVAFAYPLYSLLFFFPLCATENYALVQAIWFWFLLVALVASAILYMRVARWHPRPWLSALTILWVVLLYYSFRALILGQFAIVVLLALVASLWAVTYRHDGWAGILLAFTTVKPQMIYLAVPWILVWAAGKRRWRLWSGFFATMAALTFGSMLLVPSWLPDFVHQVLTYPSYTVFGSVTWVIIQHWLGLGHTAEIVAMAVLGLLVVILGWRLWRGSREHMLWMLGLLLVFTNFFTPRIATTNYILLIPWFLWGYQQMQLAWHRWGTWFAIATQAFLLVGPWILFLTTIRGNLEQPPVYLPLPAAALVMLIWLWTQIVKEAQTT
jgi:hypothetical protein